MNKCSNKSSPCDTGAVTMSGKVDVCIYASTPSVRTTLLGDTIKVCGPVERQRVPHTVMTAVNSHLRQDEIIDKIGRGSFIQRWPAQYKTGSTTLAVMGFIYGADDEEPTQVGSIRVDVA